MQKVRVWGGREASKAKKNKEKKRCGGGGSNRIEMIPEGKKLGVKQPKPYSDLKTTSITGTRFKPLVSCISVNSTKYFILTNSSSFLLHGLTFTDLLFCGFSRLSTLILLM